MATFYLFGFRFLGWLALIAIVLRNFSTDTEMKPQVPIILMIYLAAEVIRDAILKGKHNGD